MASHEEGTSTDAGWQQLVSRFVAVGPATAAVPEILGDRAAATPDLAFMQFGGEALTYRAFDESVTRLASGLADLGVAAGDRVAFLCDSRIEMGQLLFAGWRLGAIGVPLNVFLRGKPLEHQLTDSGSTTLFVDADGLSTVLALLDRLPELKHIVVLDEQPVPDGIVGVEFHRLSDLDGEPVRSSFPPRGLNDPALIMYTSGTTGLPKGCVLGFRYLHHVGREWTAILEITEGDVFYSASPFYHFGGIIPIMATLVSGTSLVVESQFSASRFFERVAEVGATHTIGVGWLVVALLKQQPGAFDRAHRMHVMMASPVSEPDRATFEERFGVELISEVFGQTELTLGACSTIGGRRKPGSAGRPSPWMDLAILDDDDNVLPPGEVGEIGLRPRVPGAMYSSYWNRPEATAETSSTLWHHTGDLGRLDEDGYLFFVDRKSDRLRRRGENVSSFEVEAVITTHDAVAEAAAFAVQVPGEVDDTIKACLVLAPGATLTAESIAEYFGSELPYYAAPRLVEVVEELPRNASGRVMKFQLKTRGHAPSMWDLEALGLGRKRSERRG